MDNFNTSSFDIYKDISARTKGEIYLGVIGAVRTGKSTFIKRFMEQMVLPYMNDEHDRERTIDEMPQSAAGKTIMTTEPKFIPKEAAKICLEDGTEVKVRLIDCVGYMVEGASGHMENDAERMVKTPWFDYEVPFTQAAEIGTKKVINEHSTIGIVIAADGTFTDIPRENYAVPEEKTVNELKKLGKPFIVLLNSTKPYSDETKQLAQQMQEKYLEDVSDILITMLRNNEVNGVFLILNNNKELVTLDEEKSNLLVESIRMHYTDKPMAIFMLTPDYDPSNHIIVSIFLSYQFSVLRRKKPRRRHPYSYYYVYVQYLPCSYRSSYCKQCISCNTDTGGCGN